MAGGLLLCLGSFLPTFAVGSRSMLLLEVDLALDGFPIDGCLVLGLALLSVVLALHNLCVLLWLTASFAQMALLSSYALWEPPPVPTIGCWHPFNHGLHIGWWVMELGLVLQFIAAFVGDLPPLRHWKPMPPSTECGQFPSSNPSNG